MMQNIRSRMIGFMLTGVAALLFVLVRQGSLQATLRLQSPLPPQPTACFDETLDGFTLEIDGYLTAENGATTITYRVTNANKKDISYVAFGLGDWTPVMPGDDTIVSGKLGDYHVEWTNVRGNPGFASIKFESEFDGFSQGAEETFTIAVADFDPNTPIQVQMKAGKDRTTFTVTLDGAGCDKTPPPFSPLPTPTPTPEGYALPTEPVVPPCVFEPPPGGFSDEPVIPLDAYTFSEPQVVVTNTASIDIEQWLPDSETLLIGRHTGRGSAIELINTLTAEIVRLTEPDQSIGSARWLVEDQTVVWLELGSLNRETDPGYWVRSFDPPGDRRLSDNGTRGNDAYDISPNGKELVFMSLPGGTQPLIWNQEIRKMRSLSIDLVAWRYRKGPNYPPRPFSPLWHPDGDKILFQDGTWLFLYDLNTNSGCEIDMTLFVNQYKYVREVSWSPNGRYLAIKNAESPPYTNTYGPHDLALVLDTYTGDVVQHSLGNMVYSLSWFADNQTIAMIGQTEQEIKIPDFGMVDGSGVYLLNIHSGEYRQILTDYFVGGNPGIIGSPNGARLAFLGSRIDEDKLVNGGTLVSQVTAKHRDRE